MKTILLISTLILGFLPLRTHAQLPASDQIETANGTLTVQPIRHGTLVLSKADLTVYVDPVGGAQIMASKKYR